MLGKKIYEPELFTYINIDDLIPKNHILRRIDEILDTSFVIDLTSQYYCSDNGRPSIDPEVLFRMMIVSYIFGINHDRKLCDEISYNLAYRWYCRLNLSDNVPDHSSISKIRDRYGEELFATLFDYILELCSRHGLVKGRQIITDATLFDANASIDSMVAINEDIQKSEAEALDNRKPTDPIPRRKLSNDTHISRTDPDSTLARKEGTPRTLKYKNHCTIDGDSRVIIDTKVSTGSEHDAKNYLTRIIKMQRKYNLNIQEIIADRAYGSIGNIKYLQENGMTTYIPLFHIDAGEPNRIAVQTGFKFSISDNTCECPEGHTFKGSQLPKSDTIRYTTKKTICVNCPVAKSCLAKLKKCGRRTITRHIHQELFNKENNRNKTDIFAEKLSERMWKVEGIFAEAKGMHNLSRARYRGLSKMQIQAYLVAMVQNLKRIVNNQKGSDSRPLSEFLRNIYINIFTILSWIVIFAKLRTDIFIFTKYRNFKY